MIDGVGGGKKSGEKNFFFSDVAKKIGKTWQKSVEKSSKKSWTKNELVKKISLFFNDNRSDFQSDEECSWECCCEMIDNQEINNEFTKKSV